MSNDSYSYSFSQNEAFYRVITGFTRKYQTILTAEVIKDPEGSIPDPSHVTLRILNKASRIDSQGRTRNSEFPNLLQVPVLNQFQNIKLPKLKLGQRGLVFFNKHYLPSKEEEDGGIEPSPSYYHMFTLDDGVFLPVIPQGNPSIDTTEIGTNRLQVNDETGKEQLTLDQMIARITSSKFSVKDPNGQAELIGILRSILVGVANITYLPTPAGPAVRIGDGPLPPVPGVSPPTIDGGIDALSKFVLAQMPPEA